MKILFLTNIPSPYREKFFSLLGEKCELTVIYELKYATNRDKNWKVDVNKTYKEIFLNVFLSNQVVFSSICRVILYTK